MTAHGPGPTIATPTRPGYGQGREALLRGAIAATVRDGLGKLTYRSIASEVGMTHGAVLHHFSSINDLLIAAADYSVERLLATADSSAPLFDFLEPTVRGPGENALYQQFLVLIFLECPRVPELNAAVTRSYAAYRAYTVDRLRTAGLEDDEGLAGLLMTMIDGAVYQRAVLGAEQTPLALQSDALRRILTAYLASLPPRAETAAPSRS